MGDLTVRMVLDYAIEKEKEAQRYYLQMAEMAGRSKTVELFRKLADMERRLLFERGDFGMDLLD